MFRYLCGSVFKVIIKPTLCLKKLNKEIKMWCGRIRILDLDDKVAQSNVE